ncbi:MAG: DUF308 domain-containing protein [Bacteroidales bacterium]|nr:DUF308 domain-containing protein [Bacteroidales bacterium]
MKKSTKIWLAVAGILLIVLGIVCICRPAATLFTTAWLIGCFTLFSGIAKLVFTIDTQAFLPNSGSRALSAVLQIILGCIFLGNNLFVTVSLPVIFAMWVLIEGVVIAVQSFDYNKVGFSYWWCILLLGIAGAVLGVLGLRNPDVTAATLSTLIGIGIIANGVAYIVALCGINKFDKKVEGVRSSIRGAIDEQ